MASLSRRQFGRDALGTLVTTCLLETIFRQNLLAAEVQPTAARWLKDVHQLAADLKGQQLQQVVWQQKVEALFRQIPVDDFLALIDFDRLTANVRYVDNGALSMRFQFPDVEGLPKNLVFNKQIFALRKDRSVVPHGHNNMATAFLILKGDLRGRHYDRVEDQPEHYIIRPTIDRTFTPGECSSISDFKDNVHWFKALSDTAFIFNLHVLQVNPDNREATGRLYLDAEGEPLADGLIRARKLSYDDAHKLYG